MDTVEIVIPVEADVAALISGDPERRAAAGRLVSLFIRPPAGTDPLLDTMRELANDAKARGLTPDIVAEELAAHKAERRR